MKVLAAGHELNSLAAVSLGGGEEQALNNCIGKVWTRSHSVIAFVFQMVITSEVYILDVECSGRWKEERGKSPNLC